MCFNSPLGLRDLEVLSGPKFSLTLFFSGHAGDRGLCSPGFSVVQCLRKAAVVLAGRPNHRGFLKQHKRKNAFKLHRLLCTILQGPIKQVIHRQYLTSILSAISKI